MDDNQPDTNPYKVLVNDEEQYSLWQAELDIPLGWYEKFAGSKEACLEYVKEVWTDMRPKSLREFERKQAEESRKH